MKTNLSTSAVRASLLRDAWAFVASCSLLLGIFHDARAQCPTCPTGSSEWQYVTTNLYRCGHPGYLEGASTIYYSSFITETIIEHDPETVPPGVAGSTNHTTQFDWPTDFKAYASFMLCTGSESVIVAEADPYPVGDADSCTNISTTSSQTATVTNYTSIDATGPYCLGTLFYSVTHTYTNGFTREQMVAEAARQARTHSWSDPVLSASSPLASKAWVSEYAYTGSQRADVQFVRYHIKFKTKRNVEYTVRWKLRIDEYEINTVTNSYVMGEFSEGGIIGTGKYMYTAWYEPPEPGIGQKYAASVIDIKFETKDLGCGSGGCSSGSCSADDNDSPGDGSDDLASARFWISLGAGTVDESAGVLRMDEAVPSTNLATIAALQFDINTNANLVLVVTNIDGSIHVAAPTLLARIVVTNNGYAYWIHCSTTNGGSYLTNSPFISHLIINPNGSTNTNTLRHVRFRSGSAVTNEFTCESATAFTNTWALVSGNGLKGERLAKVTDTNTQTRLESYSIFTPSTSAQLYRRDRLYWALPFNDFLLSETIDPAGLSLLTTNTYDSLGRLQLSLKPDGSWDRHEYDSTGWVVRVVRPFTNQPPTASTNDCRVTEYGYGVVAGSGDTGPSSAVGKPRTVYELVRGEIVSKTMLAYIGSDTYTRVASYPGAGWTDSGNENSHTSLDSQLRPTRSDNPDGTYTTYTYTDDSSGRLTTTRSYDSSSSEFRRVEEQVNTLGRMVSRKEYDVPSTPDILLAQELYSDPDEFFRPTKVTYLDATISVTVKQDCCNAAYTIDRDGIATTNSYDALKRLVSTTRLGITASNTLDAASRTLAQVRKGTDASLITLRTMGYDAANRVIRETNALGVVTSYSHVVDGSNQRVVTTTNADAGTRIETYFRDGQLASVTGTAAFPVRYEYGRETEGSYQHPYTKEIKLDSGGSDTAEWTKTYTDGFGRSYKTVFAGTGTPYRQSFFNNKGQLWKQRDPDGVIMLYTNNARGELAYTCIDSNPNDIIDPDGQDRITQTTNDVLANYSTNVLRTRTYVLDTHGSSTPTLLSSVETSVEGFKSWQTNAGVLSTSVKTLPSAGSYTITQTAPDSSYSITLYQNGRPTSVIRYNSGSSPIGQTTFGYDEHGRRNSVTDARTGTTTYTFNNADQVVSVTTPPPGTGAGAKTTTSYFDAMQRATNIVQPDGTTVNNVFSLRGELLRTSGSRNYPVGYSYEAQGRMKTMTNWSTFSSSAGARVTTWNYDAERGWLTNKVYDDGKGTKYSYTAAGRLGTRLWARGTNTTYTYNNYGDLSGVSYNDGATPTVSYTHNRRGQQENVTRGSDSWKLFYNTAGQLISEAGTAGTLNGLRVTNAFDAFLRRTNVTAANGATLLTTNGYTYDLASRLSTARDGTFSATYSYLANSPLVSQLEFKSNTTVRLTTTKSYDNLNRLASIASAPSASSALSYSYSYNDANQRTRVNLADGSFWIYEYDSLGQVKSGKRYWSDWTPVAGQQFEYGFDDIGNRTSTKAGGDAGGANLRLANYTNNSLNQITGRDVPAYLNVIGAATATATNVNVNNTMAYRRGEYYRVELNPINTSVAVWQSVTNRAVQSGTTNSVTGNMFLPKTAEVFSYDADGNLMNDGRWAYVWDGENRLLSITSRPSSPAGSSNALRFAYDWQGRRISKTVSNYSGSAWSKVLDEKYLYDGWNQLTSLNTSNTAVVRAFLWGTDLSGSLQGAGGVGGLLAVNAKGVSVTFAAYDGNGNVTALINAAGGDAFANYEYGPFSELLRCSGTAAKTNPFRFSTKFQDDDTDLLYYGFRYYNTSTGRWLSRDPVSDEGFLVSYLAQSPQQGVRRLRHESLKPLYAFVGNAPYNLIDLLGLEVLLETHPVKIGPIETDRNHCKITMIIGCDSRWWNYWCFRAHDLGDGRRYATIGAGPVGLNPKLVSDKDRPTDMDRTHNNYSVEIFRPHDLAEDDLIEKLIKADARYDDDLLYDFIPYLNTFNSNSYVSGLLWYVGSPMAPPPDTPGYDHPVPLKAFD